MHGEYPQVRGGYHDAGDHVKFGFPMASMTVSQARFQSKTKIELEKGKFQTIVAWGANSFYEGYEKAGQLEWFDQSNPS